MFSRLLLVVGALSQLCGAVADQTAPCTGLEVRQGTQCIPICGSLDKANYTGDKRCGKYGSCPDTLCDVPLTKNCAEYGGCKINYIGLFIVKGFELDCPTIYNIGGHQTIGWGHDCTANKETNCAAKYKPPISLPESYTILAKDMNAITDQVKKAFGQQNLAALNSNQYSAILSFAFNAGAGNAHKRFGAFVKNKNFVGLCNAIYNSKIGDPNRRQTEGRLCRMATSNPTGC